jgi:hypothetical protein
MTTNEALEGIQNAIDKTKEMLKHTFRGKVENDLQDHLAQLLELQRTALTAAPVAEDCGCTHPDRHREPTREQIGDCCRYCLRPRKPEKPTHFCDEECGGVINARHCQEAEKPAVDVDTAMSVLWDAGYKIYGRFGWVQDQRHAQGHLKSTTKEGN